MKPSNRYVKIVEWSNEDQCYVGSCPGLFYGDNEQEVFSELATSLRRQLNNISKKVRHYLCQQQEKITLTRC